MIRQGFAPGLCGMSILGVNESANIPIHLVDERYPRNVVPSHLSIHSSRLAL